MFNRKRFFDNFRAFLNEKGHKLTQSRTDALEFLITNFETDPRWKDIRHVAYALATVAHETAWKFQPIKEFRAKVGSQGRANQDRYWLSGYYGRGYIQLTWKTNYEKFGIAEIPAKALEPDTAFEIMTRGMHEGLFTPHKLSDHINGADCDYKNARKIINGIGKPNGSRDQKIAWKAMLDVAEYAKAIEKVLKASKEVVFSDISKEVIDAVVQRDNPVTTTGHQSSIVNPPFWQIPIQEQPYVETVTTTATSIPAPLEPQDTADPSVIPDTSAVGNPSVSRGSIFAALGAGVIGAATWVASWMKDNPVILVAAVILLLGALWYWNEAKKRDTARRLT